MKQLNMEHTDLDDVSGDSGTSRSQRKREAAELQRLGESLVKLPSEYLAQLPLPEELVDAIRLAQRIKAHGGHRRQIRLIGKLIRQADVPPIRDALARIAGASADTSARHRSLEIWRERMIAEGDNAVAEFVDAHPGTDSRKLRQLVATARRERDHDQPPRFARELFRFLRDIQR